VNPQLDYGLLKPYAPVTGLGTNNKTYTNSDGNSFSASTVWYVNADNTVLHSWRRLYGHDAVGGAPESWEYPRDANIMVAYEMYDDKVRPLALSASKLGKAVKEAGGSFTLYDARGYSTKADQWLTDFYASMLEFIVPPESKRKKGKASVIVEPIEPGKRGAGSSGQ
jgi:hypothetical protein